MSQWSAGWDRCMGIWAKVRGRCFAEYTLERGSMRHRCRRAKGLCGGGGAWSWMLGAWEVLSGYLDQGERVGGGSVAAGFPKDKTVWFGCVVGGGLYRASVMREDLVTGLAGGKDGALGLCGGLGSGRAFRCAVEGIR